MARLVTPIGSRADLLGELLSVGTAADPDCRVQIRIFPGKAALSLRDQITVFDVDTDPDATVVVHHLPSENWVFSGSPTSVTAMSECWREHFGLAGGELIDDHDVGWEPE